VHGHMIFRVNGRTLQECLEAAVHGHMMHPATRLSLITPMHHCCSMSVLLHQCSSVRPAAHVRHCCCPLLLCAWVTREWAMWLLLPSNRVSSTSCWCLPCLLTQPTGEGQGSKLATGCRVQVAEFRVVLDHC
jgi:hypothetical protein